MEKEEINSLVFSLVGKINVQKENNTREQELVGSLREEVPIIDLSDEVIKTSYAFEEVFQNDLGDYKVDVLKGDKRYSIPNREYTNFLKIINIISSSEPYVQKASKEYLVRNSLAWLVDVYISKKATNDLLNYLLDKIENDAEERVYYFQVLNLSIEKPFHLGHTEFTFFTKTFFDNYYQHLRNSGNWNKDDFDSIFRKYQGKVFAACKVNAEPNKAKQLAYIYACDSVDVIKLFSDTLIIPNKRCFVDLENRLNINFTSDILSRPIDNKFEISITKTANNSPFYITQKKLTSLESLPLPVFSIFLAKQDKNELERLIKGSITYFANSLALDDLHLRVSQMIMIIESLFLKEDETRHMQKKVRERLSVFRFPNNLENGLNCQQVLNEMYPIRHKMVHKAIRLYIDMSIMANFQRVLFEILLDLIKVSGKYKTKSSFIDSLN